MTHDAAAFQNTMTNDQATTLLMLGLTSGSSRQIDALLDRISETHVQPWFNRALGDVFDADAITAMLSGDIDIAGVKHHKREAKRQLTEATTQDSRLTALAGYCVTVASALAHHGTLISSRPGEEWTEVCADLAGVVSPEWRDLFTRAAERALRT